ncbi:glycosyltransferase [Altibacter lentus]|uniref:glycosyltransferase n=1 Tax=Altibacter lentus TaxID=1223410 RepID=UPI000559689A|nr:glycosyltransferase [Altibacter lentus]
MKVLQLIDSLDAGGAERMAVTLANALNRSSHEAFLCTTRKEGLLKETLDPGVAYLFLNKRNAYDVLALKKLVSFIKRHKIEVVHAHSSSYFFASLVKKILPKVRLIWHDHYGDSEHLSARRFKVLKYCSRRFDAIISVNEVLKTWALEHLHCKNVYYLQNFAGTDVQESSQDRLQGPTGYRLVCLANLRSQKDHINLLEAFKSVLEHYPEATLHLVGAPQEASYVRSLEHSIETNGLTGVYFYGSQGKVLSLLRMADVGILSSRSEGLPVALLEYGMAGLPVVCTRVGQCQEVVADRGIVVPPRDPEALAEGIRVLLGNPEKRRDLAEKFQHHIKKTYSFEAVLPILLRIYTT